MATAANGNFVVVWTSYYQDGDGYGVFGQRYASSGSALGTEFQVNTYTTGNQGSLYHAPGVAAAANGDFVVVWQSSQDGSSDGVFGQRFASNGSATGTEFQVNTYTTGSQNYPALAAAPNGDFVVVWPSSQDGSSDGVFGQRFASGGSALGTEFQVNTYTTGSQNYPALAAAPNGDFVVVWQSSQDGSSDGAFGQRFASNGSATGTEFQVNTYTTGSQNYPALAAAPNGNFVVTWRSYGQDGDYYGVFGQRFASGGSALGTEFQVNTYTTASQASAYSAPAVTALSNGDFVVVWQSPQDGSSLGVFGQHFASSGSAVGTEFQVNTYTTGFEGYPAIASDNAGGFVVVWHSTQNQDGEYRGIFGQRYSGAPPVAGCAATPLMGCATPMKSLLLIKDKNEDGAGAKDKLVWKWLKGPATMQADFGNPTTTADYNFCIYSGTAQALTAHVPSGPPWEALSTKGYKYKDALASVAGIKQILLKGGDAGKSKILVKGKDGGLDLDPSTLPFDTMANVTVQLSNSDNSNCWQSTFAPASAKKNTDGQFKAKSP